MTRKIFKKGFTLIELIVSLGLFAFVAVVSTSVMIAVIDGNKKTRSRVEAMDNLSFALDSITREIRVGSSYDCVAPIALIDTGDCAGGDVHIGFLSSELQFIEYRFDTGRMQRQVDSAGWIDMTGGGVNILDAQFYVQGSDPAPGDTEQPHITIVIEGISGGDPDTNSTFIIQTTVTQRFPDF